MLGRFERNRPLAGRIEARALLAVLAVGFLAVCARAGGRWAAALLWSLAALAVGSMIGFLFGVPRVLQVDARDPAASKKSESARDASYRIEVNTNLEQISDWLTKIIVGLGLMNLFKMPELLTRASRFVGEGLGGAEEWRHLAAALLVFFSFMAADRAAISPEEFSDELAREAQGADPTAKRLPSKAQVAAAERLGKLALSVSEPVIRRQVEDLALEYERTRSSMRAGPERTHRLDDVVRRMRTLGMAARFLLPELVASTSPGKRLVGLSLLSVEPEDRYLDWIVDRFAPDAERPFVVFHAAMALAAAGRRLEPARVRPALERAAELKTSLGADPARDRAINEALDLLGPHKAAAPAPQSAAS
jgi:hypothetical protein